MQSWKKNIETNARKTLGEDLGDLFQKHISFRILTFWRSSVLVLNLNVIYTKFKVDERHIYIYISPIRMHILKQGRKGVHVPKHFCMLQSNHTCSWTITATSSLFSSSSMKSMLTNILYNHIKQVYFGIPSSPGYIILQTSPLWSFVINVVIYNII